VVAKVETATGPRRCGCGMAALARRGPRAEKMAAALGRRSVFAHVLILALLTSTSCRTCDSASTVQETAQECHPADVNFGPLQREH
jgi:hypothetical protein